jgi:hypothetical protein
MPKHKPQIYQLKVRLQGSKPPIWRRILITGDVTLAALHDVLQVAMGWTDSHLHQFEQNGQVFGTANNGFGSLPVADERRTRLDRVLRREKDALRYVYDFGDGWDHQITLEKLLPHNHRQQLPVCIKGKGACPPEDIGGLWGYYAVLEALRDPRHPDHEEYEDMFGPELDPDAFAIEEVNALLHSSCGKAA